VHDQVAEPVDVQLREILKVADLAVVDFRELEEGRREEENDEEVRSSGDEECVCVVEAVSRRQHQPQRSQYSTRSRVTEL